MPTSSGTCLIVIRRLSKTIFFTSSMFSSIVDVLGRPGRKSSLTSSRPSINRLNLCSAHNGLAKGHSQYFKCPCTFNFIFYTKLNTVSSIYFSNCKKSKSIPNTTNLFICQKQTDNSKWLILSTYIIAMCTNITKNCENWTYATDVIWK